MHNNQIFGRETKIALQRCNHFQYDDEIHAIFTESLNVMNRQAKMIYWNLKVAAMVHVLVHYVHLGEITYLEISGQVCSKKCRGLRDIRAHFIHPLRFLSIFITSSSLIPHQLFIKLSAPNSSRFCTNQKKNEEI